MAWDEVDQHSQPLEKNPLKTLSRLCSLYIGYGTAEEESPNTSRTSCLMRAPRMHTTQLSMAGSPHLAVSASGLMAPARALYVTEQFHDIDRSRAVKRLMAVRFSLRLAVPVRGYELHQQQWLSPSGWHVSQEIGRVLTAGHVNSTTSRVFSRMFQVE